MTRRKRPAPKRPTKGAQKKGPPAASARTQKGKTITARPSKKVPPSQRAERGKRADRARLERERQAKREERARRAKNEARRAAYAAKKEEAAREARREERARRARNEKRREQYQRRKEEQAVRERFEQRKRPKRDEKGKFQKREEPKAPPRRQKKKPTEKRDRKGRFTPKDVIGESTGKWIGLWESGWQRIDGTVAHSFSSLREHPDAQSMVDRLRETGDYRSDAWRKVAEQIAKAYNVHLQEVYTLGISP